MDRNVVKERLTKIFRSTFTDSNLTLTDEMTAGDVDNWDSLTHMTLIMAVENDFRIKFKLRELNKIINVGDLIDCIETKLN